MQSQGAFHQGPERGAFNQAIGRGTFNQAFGRGTFNQTIGRGGSAFNQGAFNNALAHSLDSSNQNNGQNSNNSSLFGHQKRGGGNRGGNTNNSRGRGNRVTSTPKRGAKTNQASHPFQRKPNNVNDQNWSTNNELIATPNETSKTTAADRVLRFGSTEKSVLYDQFKESRVRERQQAIEYGLIPDPNNPTRLEDAIDFRGTCQTKCPEFEMLEREIQNGLDSLEMDDQGNLDPEKAVKAYRRSAAGIDQPLPSDVRSPEALVSTLDYLIDDILSHQPLEKCHAFVRDRTRSIRQDFTLQNIRDIAAVQVHERIARFHILCLHEMCELDEGKFSKQQETEQLRKVLVSLMEFYDDLREEGIETENEAEFRAYNIISHIRDQDIARQAMTLPIYLFKSSYVTRALEFRALSQRNNEIMESSSRRNKPENIEASQNFYSSFFKLIADPGTSFLMACMLESHFADVRKGALKAMNVSYMIKAGGVQAEDVRQVLAYDTMKQLFEEANLYGIIIDNSLGEPTLCFGQKHYLTKISVFIEPLSNPPQKKSLLLVEPKKAGRTFRDIVNGINAHATPLPNQNVFARQNNPVKKGGAFNFAPKNAKAKPFGTPVPTITNTKLSDVSAGEANISKQKENEDQLEMVRSKAAAAVAMAARERKKMEALEAAKKEEASRLELERQERLIKEQKKKEEREKEEEAQRQEALRRQQRERQMAQMHLNVIKSQLSNMWVKELLDHIIKEQARAAVLKAVKSKKLLKKIATPWLARARSAIHKRTSKAMERKRQWHFNMYVVTNNPYIPSEDTIYKATPVHSRAEGIKERVNQSILAEKIALENTKPPVNQESVWKSEEFSLCIYPRIRDKIMDLKQSRLNTGNSTKPSWQLVIDVPNSDLDSSIWFRKKFGLDDVFLRKDGLYQALDIIIRMATPQKEVSCQIADEIGAVIFSLPESKSDKNQSEFASYWEENKQRLDLLIEKLRYYNPGMQIPFLFTYFPDSSLTESTLEKIPKLLGLDTNRLVSDYHILVMNPLTIPTRIIHEVNWLSNNTVINQQ